MFGFPLQYTVWIKFYSDADVWLSVVGWFSFLWRNSSACPSVALLGTYTVKQHGIIHRTAYQTRMHSQRTNLRRSGGSGFRTLDSRIRSVIRIATKIVSLGPWAMPYPSEKFRQNPFTSLRVIRRTDRQTDRQTDKQTNRPNQKHNLLLRRR